MTATALRNAGLDDLVKMNTTTTTLTESEFIAFVAKLVTRKVKGEMLVESFGGYDFEVATQEGTYRLKVSGGTRQSWTRRQNISPANLARTAATLFRELNREEQPEVAEVAEAVAVEESAPVDLIQAARTAIAAARTALRTYGPSSIPVANARTAARNAIAQALHAGAKERDLLAA